MNPWIRKALFYLALAAVLSSLTAGAYALLARFLADRQTALADVKRPPAPALARQRQAQNARDIERARREGRLPPNVPAATNPGEAAVQRQLRTLEEINRINEMNRRLLEQQQRLQNQR